MSQKVDKLKSDAHWIEVAMGALDYPRIYKKKFNYYINKI